MRITKSDIKRIIPLVFTVIFLLFGCNGKSTDTKSPNTNGKWIIKETNGSVVVYKNEEPIIETRIVISSLPRSEALKLKEGIEASSLEEVQKLIELYES